MAVRINRYRVELVRESAACYELESKQIKNPADAAQVIHTLLDVDSLVVEHFGVLTLDTKNVVIGFHILHIGTLNSAAAHKRNIFQAAILNNAASIIMFHNHPSGDCTPSPEDIEFTKQTAMASKLLGFVLIDHIIVGHSGKSLSLKGHGGWESEQ